ncbi:hypothetical protein M422DRAFT_42676 [Sphaerobolus stellatus SS14]|nr:hypothetical protein M422DRAFT_42676 [Sphaerobolus stellatus SS14]
MDGDVVLIFLPSEGVRTGFKIDKAFLKRASPGFEVMFTLPPTKDVEVYDYVPLVRLHDPSDHLEQFLCALYDLGQDSNSFKYSDPLTTSWLYRTIPFEKLQSDTISRVEDALILATKYQADALCTRIIAALEAD